MSDILNMIIMDGESGMGCIVWDGRGLWKGMGWNGMRDWQIDSCFMEAMLGFH